MHGPPLTTKHGNEEDHLVSETLTEDSEAGALLLLHGKMLFLTHSAKGNPLGGLYIPSPGRTGAEVSRWCAINMQSLGVSLCLGFFFWVSQKCDDWVTLSANDDIEDTA